MKWKRWLGAGFTVGLALAGTGACKTKPRPDKSALPPLVASSWRVPLEASGFGSAALAVPLAATKARPVLIAIHGDADHPEWQCGAYRGVVKPQSFILCPRGVERPDGRFTLGSTKQTSAELRALLQQLKSRFGRHVARGEVVLAGLGPGVEHVIALALEEPHFFSRLVLVDGSTRALTPAVATRLGQHGGRRVLALCTPGACDPDVDERVNALRPPGVETRVLHLQNGRGLSKETTLRLAQEWSWLVSGDLRWR